VRSAPTPNASVRADDSNALRDLADHLDDAMSIPELLERSAEKLRDLLAARAVTVAAVRDEQIAQP